MSANLPLTWLDKKNSPELEAFLKQYGDEYYMTAEQINQMRDAVNEMAEIQKGQFLGVAEPADIPEAGVSGYWEVITPGTYTNHGNVVLGTDQRGLISLTKAGVFKISKVAFSFVNYALKTDLNKHVAWAGQVFITTNNNVNHLGKDWYNNAATVAGDIPGASTKWVERLSYGNLYSNYNIINTTLYSFVIADQNGNIGYYIGNDGISSGNKKSPTETSLIQSTPAYSFAIVDENGYVAMYIDNNGNFSPQGNNPTGITWNALGDSITFLNDNIGTKPIEKGYMTIVKDNLGIDNYRNYGINGRDIIGLNGDRSTWLDAELWSILIGTNDWHGGAIKGTFETDYINRTNNGSFAAIYREMLEFILAKNPSATILLMTPFYRGNYVGATLNSDFPRNDNLGNPTYLKDYADIVVKIAKYEGLPYIDFYNQGFMNRHNVNSNSNITSYTSKDIVSYDNLHPNTEGYRRMSRQIEQVLRGFMYKIVKK